MVLAVRKCAAIKAITANSAVVHRPVQQRNPVFRSRLGEDVAHVVVDCAFADRQSVSDFLVGQSLCHQFNDFDLASREGNAEWIGRFCGCHGPLALYPHVKPLPRS